MILTVNYRFPNVATLLASASQWRTLPLQRVPPSQPLTESNSKSCSNGRQPPLPSVLAAFNTRYMNSRLLIKTTPKMEFKEKLFFLKMPVISQNKKTEVTLWQGTKAALQYRLPFLPLRLSGWMAFGTQFLSHLLEVNCKTRGRPDDVSPLLHWKVL